MKGFNECPNGHFYQTHLNKCPYCPSGESTAGNFDKTMIDSVPASMDRTIIDKPASDKTIIDTPNRFAPSKTVVEKEPVTSTPTPPPPPAARKDLSKTYIVTDDVKKDDKGEDHQVVRTQRKLVGWLVSYTIDPLGRDYRLYEGRNTLGANKTNDIILNTDATVSGQHCVILYRSNNFYIKDHLSTNGTKVNGKELEPESSEKFTDGATLNLGDTEFLFKAAF